MLPKRRGRDGTLLDTDSNHLRAFGLPRELLALRGRRK
jgi:hypothetical protein